MHINNNTQANNVYQRQSPISNVSNNSGVLIKNETTTVTASISNDGLKAMSNLQIIANNYDVTNISHKEICSMTFSLRDNKLISSTECMCLCAPPSMNFDPDVKFDLLATERNAIDFAKANGDSAEGLKTLEGVVDILETLQKLSQ